jgi:hypothetical protein
MMPPCLSGLPLMKTFLTLSVALLAATPALADRAAEIESRAVCFRHEGAELPPLSKTALPKPGEILCNEQAAKGETCAALESGSPAEMVCLKRELSYWEGAIDTVTGPGFGEERRPGQRAAIVALAKSFRAYRTSYCRGQKLIAVNPPETKTYEIGCAIDLTIEFIRSRFYPAIYSP